MNKKVFNFKKSFSEDHIKVHSGNIKCPVCNIMFTKASLVYHYKRAHPNLAKKDRILQAIENCASKKVNFFVKKVVGMLYAYTVFTYLHSYLLVRLNRPHVCM